MKTRLLSASATLAGRFNPNSEMEVRALAVGSSRRDDLARVQRAKRIAQNGPHGNRRSAPGAARGHRSAMTLPTSLWRVFTLVLLGLFFATEAWALNPGRLIEIKGSPTENGTITITIGGNSLSVPITAGMTCEQICAAVNAAAAATYPLDGFWHTVKIDCLHTASACYLRLRSCDGSHLGEPEVSEDDGLGGASTDIAGVSFKNAVLEDVLFKISKITGPTIPPGGNGTNRWTACITVTVNGTDKDICITVDDDTYGDNANDFPSTKDEIVDAFRKAIEDDPDLAAVRNAEGQIFVAIGGPDIKIIRFKSASLPWTTVMPEPHPLLLAVTPGSGPLFGGTLVTLHGSYLGPGAAITFGGMMASVINYDPALDTYDVIVPPAVASGPVDVVAIPPGRDQDPFNTLPDGFVYQPLPGSPAIISQPVDTVVPIGQTAVLTVAAVGDEPLTYEWRLNGVPLPGQIGPVCTLPNTRPADTGDYSVFVSNPFGAVTSAMVRVTVFDPNTFVPPIKCFTPEAWLAEPVPWFRDVAPQNKIDDLIDASPDNVFDVVVNFRRCIDNTDMQFLSCLGTVQFRSAMITTVLVGGVSKANVQRIASLGHVAFVEQQQDLTLALNTSLPTICMTPGSPDCFFSVPASRTGAGVNIAIIDSGMANQHRSMTNRSLGGVDYSNLTWGDPNDNLGHGTLVGSVTLGKAAPGYGLRGVATQARFYDVKVTDASLRFPTYRLWRALTDIYNLHAARLWRVDVVLMSLAESVPSSGIEALPQMVNFASSFGMTVVAAAGELPSGIPAPGSASRAITVGASDDKNTAQHSDDTIWPSSSRGPRASDGNGNPWDEYKPEFAAPGVNITGAAFNTSAGTQTGTGTSLAAAHVAGIVACMIQRRAGLSPATIKAHLQRSAQARGVNSLPPGMSGWWNNQWGAGLINAYDAIEGWGAYDARLDLLKDPVSCDPLRYPNLTAPNGSPLNPHKDVFNDVLVRVRSCGPSDAFGALVYLGAVPTSISSTNFRVFDDIGMAYLDVLRPLPKIASVRIPWKPARAGAHTLRAEVAFINDSLPADNVLERPLLVQNSPVTFRVENYLTMEPRRITLVPTLVYSNGAPEQVVIQPAELFLGGGDCPAEVNAQIIRPANASPGWRQTANIKAFLDTGNGTVSLGSVPLDAGDRPHEVRIESVDRVTRALTLAWDGGGTLQQASRVTGPWVSLAGAASPFTTPMVVPQRYFRVFETNWCSLTIVQQPRHTIAPPGGPVTFAVEAWALEGPFTYQWQEDRGMNIGWQDIPGATGPAYMLPGVGPAEDGILFRVVIANGCTNVVSDPAKLTIGCEIAPPTP